MPKTYDVAVVGGHGLVSRNIIKDLITNEFPFKSITVYGSKEHASIPLEVEEMLFDVQVIDETDIKKHDIVFFSGSDALSYKYAEEFIKKGAKVIDNSSTFRMLESVPLVIPEINGTDLLYNTNIYAVPNCTTTMMLVALDPLHKYFDVERIIVSSYQSASGYGKLALEELLNEQLDPKYRAKVLPSRNVDKKRLFNNILPIVDEVDEETNYTKEELKMREETRKIWHDAEIEVQATCVRVPTHVGHGASISAICKEKIDLNTARKLIKECSWLRLKEQGDYPDVKGVEGTKYVDVGRMRVDLDCEYTINMFVTSDNLVRGASYTAVMIAFKLIDLRII